MWYHKGIEVDTIPDKAIGFVYVIVYTDHTKYIGKKNFYSTTRKRISPRRYQYITKESNWRSYKGSNKNTKDKPILKKIILEYAYTKRELTYLEAKYQFIHEVLESPMYHNENILGKFYRNVRDDSV